MRKMAGPFLAIFDDDEHNKTSRISRATPVYQRRLDALNELNDIELLRRYRFDKAGIEVCGVNCYLLMHAADRWSPAAPSAPLAASVFCLM